MMSFLYRPGLRISKCNMNYGVNDPNFEVDLGISFLISSVNIQAEITKNHFVPKGSKIPFDKEIFDPTKSFFIENSTFIAPWTGIFTFTKEMFRESYHNYESNSASMYGYINGQKYPTFEIKTSGSRKHFNQGESMVIHSNTWVSITLGCNDSHPCRLKIMGEEN